MNVITIGSKLMGLIKRENRYVLAQVGRGGFDYFAERVSNHPFLGSMFLHRRQYLNGTLLVLVPSSLKEIEPVDLAFPIPGGLPSAPFAALASCVKQHLDKGPMNAFVIEDPVHDEGNKWADKFYGETYFHNHVACRILTSASGASRHIGDAVQQSFFPNLFLGLITTLRRDVPSLPNAGIGIETLEEFADAARAVVVGVYDDDSFLLWLDINSACLPQRVEVKHFAGILGEVQPGQ